MVKVKIMKMHKKSSQKSQFVLEICFKSSAENVYKHVLFFQIL